MVVPFLSQWSSHFIMAIPLLFLPPMIYLGNKPLLCAYVMLWVVIYWVSAVLPLGVTALMPLVLFPVLGILSTEETTTSYFNEVGAIILGSMLFVVALKETGLAKRVALRMLYSLGTSNSSLLLAFMLCTALLSTSLPNTASAAVMAPVVMAMIEQMRCQTKLRRDLSMATASSVTSPHNLADVYKRAQERLITSLTGMSDESLMDLRRELMMSVAYASSIGGMGTHMGSPPNFIMKKLYEKRFPNAPRLEPRTWMLTCVPITVICLLAAWACFYWRLRHLRFQQKEESRIALEKIQREVERRYTELGRIRSAEIAVLLLMALLVYLWVFRLSDSPFSWTRLLPADADASVLTGIFIASMPLFLIPRSHQSEAIDNPTKPFDPILTWQMVGPLCQWNLIFLISGSMTFSKAAQTSGLSHLVLDILLNMEAMNHVLVMVVLCLLTAALTQVFSNSAVSSLVIPVVLDTAVKLQMHPMSLAMPVALSCSFSFMLPASTPPNALVYDMAGMGVRDMVCPGLVVTITNIIVCVALIISWGRFALDLGEFPPWASDNVTSTAKPSVT